MKSRTLPFLLCIVTLIGLTVWMFLLSQELGKVRKQLLESTSIAQGAESAAKAGQDQLDTLSRQQRETRMSATAEEAIRLSATIQRIQTQVDQARAERDEANAQSAETDARLKGLQLHFVPIIAVMLAALVGCFLFYPRRIV